MDLGSPVTVLDCHLAGEFGYRDSGSVTGTFAVSAPFPARVDVDRLG